VRKATAYGSACPQAENPETEELTKEMVQTLEPYYTVHTAEDGPYLNVWTTNMPGSHSDTEKLPVMFWIHGDGCSPLVHRLRHRLRLSAFPYIASP
jgi:carboxylesterase type B